MLRYANADRDNSTLRSSLYLLLTAEEYTLLVSISLSVCHGEWLPQSSLSPLTYAHFLRGGLYKGSQKKCTLPKFSLLYYTIKFTLCQAFSAP